MAMTAALTINTGSSVLISGQKFTASLVISNSSGGNVNLNSIQPYLLNQAYQVAGNVRFSTIANPAGYTGAAVIIPASGSSTFNFDVVIDDGNDIPGGPLGDSSNVYFLGVTCYTSDGSVFSPSVLACAVTANMNPTPNGTLGSTTILGGSAVAYNNVRAPGFLQFDQSLNSAFVPLAFG